MSVTKEEFEKRIEADHLAPEEEMKEDLERDVKGIKRAGLDPDDPMAQRQYTFQLEYFDKLKKRWAGQFTTKILSIRERQLVGALRSRMSGGSSMESLDALTIEINLMLAHLAYSLTERPDWAKELGELEDIGIVQAVYAEVAAHEARFLGWE
jgi:hypothetical protein